MDGFPILSLMMAVPMAGAIACLFAGANSARWIALIATLVDLVLGIALWANFDQAGTAAQWQFQEYAPIFGRFAWALGIDGIALMLIVLTVFLMPICIGASWQAIQKRVGEYMAAFLFMEVLMIGVFTAQDIYLFYVMFEAGLIPMYLIIGIWGGADRIYASYKFFLYTLLGSVLMLIAMMWMVHEAGTTEIPALMAYNFAPEAQTWLFLAFFASFAVKMPMWPVHTWLPDAHVQAPTAGSVILAGVLLKMGGYGIIRICYPICPEGGYQLAWFVCAIGVISMVYGAFAALAQKDFKRLVAYSSVSHMGYVVVGFGVWSASGPLYNSDYWNMGINGAMFQMIGHGVSSAGMFFMVGVVYDRVHHRNLDEFGGLFSKMPVYSGLAIGLFFAGLGLPGLCGFIGEVLVVLSIWNFSKTLAILSAAVVILTAGYILWTLQRVYLGAEYRGPHEEALTPSTMRENVIAGTLLAFAILLGVLPYHTVLQFMEETVDQQVNDLTRWKQAKDEKDKKGARTEDTALTVPPVVPIKSHGPARLQQTTSATERLPTQPQPSALDKVSLVGRQPDGQAALSTQH